MTAATFILIFFSVSLNASAQILLRKAMTAGTLPPLDHVMAFSIALAGNLWLWAGMLSYAISIGSWLIVLGRVEVSAAYPMLSVGYIIAAILGVMFLGEAVNIWRAAGIALICAGVVVIARSA
jgi:multidrug transporter EmrE-like cation transporter